MSTLKQVDADGREDIFETFPQIVTKLLLQVTLAHSHDLLGGSEKAKEHFHGIKIVDDVLVGYFLTGRYDLYQFIVLVHTSHHLLVELPSNLISFAIVHQAFHPPDQ